MKKENIEPDNEKKEYIVNDLKRTLFSLVIAIVIVVIVYIITK
jgi:hypothetical protein